MQPKDQNQPPGHIIERTPEKVIQPLPSAPLAQNSEEGSGRASQAISGVEAVNRPSFDPAAIYPNANKDITAPTIGGFGNGGQSIGHGVAHSASQAKTVFSQILTLRLFVAYQAFGILLDIIYIIRLRHLLQNPLIIQADLQSRVQANISLMAVEVSLTATLLIYFVVAKNHNTVAGWLKVIMAVMLLSIAFMAIDLGSHSQLQFMTDALTLLLAFIAHGQVRQLRASQ